MKVYVLTEHWIIDTGESGLETAVYSNLNDARQELKARQERAIQDFSCLDTDTESSENNFMIWATNSISEQCIDITITENEVI